MKLGVIIGRFQTPYLHEGHCHLIDTAIANSDKVLIILGCTVIRDKRNPYTFSDRELMISEMYPDVIISFIFDDPDNMTWSKDLDDIIAREEIKDVTLFGSRDSFVNCYLTGIHAYQHVTEIPGVSATKIRENEGI